MMDTMGKALQEKMAGYRDEMLFHFKQLLRIDSVRGERQPGAPFGEGNRKALDYVLELSRAFGLETVNLDYYIGYSEYGQGQDYICSVAHLDVVPPGDGWSFPPFAAQERDGVLYARGAGDDKPGVIAGLYALRCMKELNYQPSRRIRVIYGCAEETGMEDLDHYLASQPLPSFGFTPDSDGYDIVNAEKGRMEFRLSASLPRSPLVSVTGGLASNMVPALVTAVYDKTALSPEELSRLPGLLSGADLESSEADGALTVTFRGISAHAAMPESGRNAIAMYAGFTCRLLGDRADPLTRFIHAQIGSDWNVSNLDLACRDAHMGALTLNLGLIGTENGRIRTVGDIRYPTVTNARLLQSQLKALAAQAGLELEILSAVDGHHCTCQEEFDILRQVCLDKGKREPKCRAIAGGTYAKKFQGRLVAFGGCGDKVHSPDEFVEIADFFDHTDMVSYALYCLSRPREGTLQ